MHVELWHIQDSVLVGCEPPDRNIELFQKATCPAPAPVIVINVLFEDFFWGLLQL